jgi:pimeloyl-ACP methyl ester carboxylesterase
MDRSTVVNGVRLSYEITDWRAPYSDQERWMVFVHGLHSSNEHWFNQVPVFASEFRVLRMDLRGHGESDTPDAGLSIDDYTNDVAALIEHVGIEQAHVVGGSAGGFIAQQLAVRMPGVVKSVVLTGTAAQIPGSFSPDALAEGVRERGVNEFFLEFARRDTSAPTVDENVYQMVMGIMLGAGEELILRRIREGLTYNGLEDAGRVSCPALVVTGEHDGTFPVALSVELWDALPNGQLSIIPDCGHIPQLECPGEYTAIVRRFIRSVEALM